MENLNGHVSLLSVHLDINTQTRTVTPISPGGVGRTSSYLQCHGFPSSAVDYQYLPLLQCFRAKYKIFFFTNSWQIVCSAIVTEGRESGPAGVGSINNYVLSTLSLSSARVEHGGRYECRATNAHGSIAHAARLNVYGNIIFQAYRIDSEQQSFSGQSCVFTLLYNTGCILILIIGMMQKY